MIKKIALMLGIIPAISLSMLMPTARQLARVVAPLTGASSMRQNLHRVTHDTDFDAHKRWYAAHEEASHIKARKDPAALKELLQEHHRRVCEWHEWRECKGKSADFGNTMLVGYGVIVGGVFGLTGCPALVEALAFGTTEPHFFAFLFNSVMPTVVIGGSSAGFLGIGAHIVSKVASVQERRSIAKVVELSRSLQLLNALAAAEKKASATDETQKPDA